MKFFLIKLISHSLNLLPNRILLLLGNGLGLLWFYLIPIRKKTIIDNMTLAFGDEKTPGEIEKLAAKNLRHIGCVLFEALRSIVWSAEDFRKHVPLIGWDSVDGFIKAKQGGFVISLHLGSWELAPGSGASHGIPVDVVAKYARKKGADPLLQWYRQRLGMTMIPETRSTPQILEAISRGRWVGFMMDQFMGPPVGVPVKFFGHTAGTTGSLAALTEKHNIPCVLATTYRDKKGKVFLVMEPMPFPKFSDDFNTRVWEKTQYINDILEKKVREYPEQWFWLHRRWKSFNGESKFAIQTEMIPQI